MNLNEAEIGRAMNPPNDIGNQEMNEESKEMGNDTSTTSAQQRRYAKRNCRKIQEDD